MNNVGIALHGISDDEMNILKKYNIDTVQIMSQHTGDGSIIWTPEMINHLRSVVPNVKIYSHAMFKIVLGKYYPTTDIFTEHYKYLCKMGVHGYVVHIPSNIEMNYCVEFVAKLFKKTYQNLGDVKPTTRVYFEHVPSEIYSVANNMVKLGSKLKEKNLLLPVGLCIDTCHLYVSGISLESKTSAGNYIRTVELVGIPLLIHFNDSQGEFSSFIDRHAQLGTKIWLNDKSGMKYISNTEHDKILELANPVSSLELLKSSH